ncbi:MAG: hypothetical protein GX301_02785 [Gracilibacteraceae bacterium]|nr:hypothetical protein [Gracilibacteraceae bacterium]
MLKIKYKFKISLLLILLIVFNSVCIDAAPLTDIGDNNNIAPKIDLNVSPVKKPVDIVILTDYTGIKLASLNTQINALKAQFSTVNVDPVFHIIGDMKKVGTQSDQIYKFRRYATYNYQVNHYRSYTPSSSWNDYPRHWMCEQVVWEETQGLLSQFAFLPQRNPKNVTFTKTGIMRRTTSRSTTDYYNVTINCTGDIKTSSGPIEVVKYYTSDTTAREWDYLISENVVIDKNWTISDKISDVNYDMYSLDFSKINTVPLRSGSDRHMIFLSDGAVKDYGQSAGNYFSFGDMTETVKNYIKTNNFSLYGVAPDKTRYMTLNNDKVLDIEQFGLFTLFQMENGDILRLGNSLFADQLSTGGKMYPYVSDNINGVKKLIFIGNYSNITTYMLMEDGKVKKSTDGTNFSIIPELENINVKEMHNYGSSNWHNFYILSAGGQFYSYVDGVLTPYVQSGVIIDRILMDAGRYIFLTSTGEPYVNYEYYDGNSWITNRIRRLQVEYVSNGTTYRTNMPAIKDAREWRLPGSTTGIVVLYTNGNVEQFDNFTWEHTDKDKYGRYYEYFHLLRSENYRCLESNVSSLDSTDYGVILNKTDGTTRMLSSEVVVERYYDDDDGKWRYKYIITRWTASKPIPLNNLTRVFFDKNILSANFFRDATGKVYRLISTSDSPYPTGSAIVDMGVSVKNVVKHWNSSILYVLYNNGDLYTMTYSNNVLGNPVLLYSGIKNVFSLAGQQTYILRNDGSVLGIGYTNYGQLGVKNSATINTLTNPFNSSLTFDTSKTYLSLLDIFNNILDSKFYAAGAYATALNDIYNKYSSYSSGNMYVLLGDAIKYESAYSDYESDPEYSRKWIISHDPYYFDNSMGLSAYHNPAGAAASPPVKLDKVGKYIINLKARDNPKSDLKFLNDSNEDKNYYKWSLGDHNLTVYVHRKPIALQRVSITDNGDGTFTVKAYDAGSYDPDHSVTRADKGITAREWRWKEETSTVWTSGQMNKSDCTPDESYITQLRVKDVEGVWSDYAAITIDRNNPPAAFFTIDKTLISTSEWLKVKDMSFPQSFSSITDWHWIVKKLNADGSVPSSNMQDAKFTNSNTGTGTLAGYDKNVKYSYSSTGKYRIYLRVKDSNGLWSDGGADSAPVLDSFYSQDITVDSPPAASFTIEKNPIFVENILQLRDTSTSTGISPVTRWHWIVKKLNADGSVPAGNVQNEIFSDSNTGTGSMAGYDVNVKTNYADKGPGTYRIYLRVMNGNGMWSDGGTDSAYNLNSFFYEDLVVQESFKMSSFRVARIRDLHLEPYYEYNGEYIDRPFYVNSMAIDQTNFMSGGISAVPGFSSLTKGYRFEFEIDTINFNEANDTIEIELSFYSYTPGVPGVRGPQSDLYWEDSNKEIYKSGEGGHSSWARIVLDESNRTITGENGATWRGEYFIPATSWLVPQGTSAANAKANRINADIIVNFTIRGYRNGEMKYDYNEKQWPIERTEIKYPYEIGDVIRYDHTKSSLEDMDIIINRP